MEDQKRLDLSNKGWGSDLAPENRPGVPRQKEKKIDPDAHWETPEQQVPKVEINVSTERPGITPVFGTASPPRGLSGRIRRHAYTFGESGANRWMLLIFADRVDMLEGILDDLKRGHIPNIVAEMGLKSEYKHNPKFRQRVNYLGMGIGAYLGYKFLKLSFRARRCNDEV